jgi:hypothetical protein
LNHQMQLTIVRISEWHDSLKSTVWQLPIHSVVLQALGMWQRAWQQLSIFKTSGQWPAQAGCTNGSYFKVYPCIFYHVTAVCCL